MADPSFALIQSGTISGVTNMSVSGGTIQRADRRFDVTESGDGAGGFLQAKFTNSLRYGYRASLTGLYTTASGGPSVQNTYPKPAATAVSGAPISRVSVVQLTRRINWINATAAGDAVAEPMYAIGQEQYYGNAYGYMIASESPIDAAPEEPPSTTLVIAGGGVTFATGVGICNNFRERGSFRQGGPWQGIFDFVYTGTVTGLGPFANRTVTLSALLSNGATISGSLCMETTTIVVNFRDSGPIEVSVSGPIKGPLTVV